ncbi:MAG: DUF1538 domain-containing protein [Lachnospiraceae bacterium]|nr:DUF1538 domain-containing protein [Lachnospiraceae bacterium]
MQSREIIREKIQEAVASVLPITLIVAVLCLFLIPVSNGLLLSFLIGSLLLIVGMGLFTLGADMSMTQIGTHIGTKMTQSRKVWFIVTLGFVLGVAVTLSEPDLQVLATYVPGIDRNVLMLTVSVGVGLFLAVSLLRILLRIPLRWLLLGCYAVIFVLAALSDPDFLAVAFDSGGVTTGPMTVPFIMALGVGVTSLRSDEKAKSDSFGLVALCSVGPVLAVLILGLFYQNSAGSGAETIIQDFENSVLLGRGYLAALPEYMEEVALALLPIFAFFLAFQIISLRLQKIPLIRILIGIVYTYVGLVLFLTGANVGFSSLGYVLGTSLGGSRYAALLIPLAMVMGWFIIRAEPSVHVLNRQVEELSAGAISGEAMGMCLSIAIALAMGLSMIRVLTGISILWFLIPGYVMALALTFLVPDTFTAIAFDSGGVASGPLTATFMLPFAMGATAALGGNVMTDAFGLVALVAMMPLITVQGMGALYVLRTRRAESGKALPQYADDEIIELWEVR